jgi:hypothetical protein
MASPDVARMSEEPVVVRSRGWNLIFAGLRAFGALVCLLAATSGAGGVAGEVGFALLAAGTAVVAARGLRTGVYVWPAEVVVRNTFRTYHLPWGEIEEVGPPSATTSIPCLAQVTRWQARWPRRVLVALPAAARANGVPHPRCPPGCPRVN